MKMRIFSDKISWHVCRCLFSCEVSARICEWKMLPRNVFMALFCLLLFMQNLFLPHQQLVIVLVARIRLLWTLEVLIQLRRRCHRRRFHPYWIFPRPAEYWFEIHLHHRHFPETLFRRNMWMGRESFDDLLRLLCGSILAQLKWSKSYGGHVHFVIHMLRNLMTQWRIDVKEQMIFSPCKIFTASTLHMSPVTGLARLPGRIPWCVHMGNFSPVDQDEFKKHNQNGGT